MLSGDDPIAGALDAINDAPICPQWCYVRDNAKKDFVEAGKEDTARESFAKLVRVTAFAERERAEFLARGSDLAPELSVHMDLPVIVVHTPHLYIYDAIARSLVPTGHLVLHEMHETDSGIQGRYVNVVTEAEAFEFMIRVQRAASTLQVRCNASLAELLAISKEQGRRQFRVDSDLLFERERERSRGR